jgi:hypothetical protein
VNIRSFLFAYDTGIVGQLPLRANVMSCLGLLTFCQVVFSRSARSKATFVIRRAKPRASIPIVSPSSKLERSSDVS